MKKYFILITATIVVFQSIAADAIKTSEDDFYKIVTIPIPEGVALEVGGLCTMPNGKIAICTRRGEVFLLENANMENESPAKLVKFAEGLHEPLGIAYKDGSFYVAQRGELTKISDLNNDGIADAYEQVTKWPLSGNYHEYSFGPKIDKKGDFIITTNIGFDPKKYWVAKSYVPYRGFMFKVKPDGTKEIISNGHRSPAGLYVHSDGEYFYSENQGDWMGSGGITHVEKGNFVGNPSSLIWNNMPENPVKLGFSELMKTLGLIINYMDANDVNETGDYGKPMFEAAKIHKEIKTQAITLPHSVMGQSTSDFLYNDGTNGFASFFDGQVFVGDQAQSKIMRLSLEKVKGIYQGAAFPFIEGFQSGVMRLDFASNGDMYVGQTSRGWGSTGRDKFGLQKLVWMGKTPFEMKNIKAMPDGFEVEFTYPVSKEIAENTDNYKVTSFTYKYHHFYGSPIINDKECRIQGVVASSDGKSVRIVADGLREGYIHEIKLNNIISKDNFALLHNTGYYTLKVIPDGEKLIVMKKSAVKKTETTQTKPVTSTLGMAKKPAAPKPAEQGGKNVTKMPASWAGNADKTINIATQPGLMYDQTKITIKAGSKIKLIFTNNDDMMHNVVIVKPGKGDEIGEAANNMGLEGPKIHYIPKSDNVLYHTKLVGPGSNETIYFVAPTTPGSYTIVCTYPGHYATMQALLVVQ